MYFPKTALLSARENGLALLRFAKDLHARGWSLYASGGTARSLEENGLPVTDTGKWERPKLDTLSYEVRAALLARLDNTNHLAELHKLDVEPFGLVYIEEMPPLKGTPEGSVQTLESMTRELNLPDAEMLLSAIQGHRIVLVRKEQFRFVLEFIDTYGDMDDEARRKKFLNLATEALVNVGTRLVELGISPWRTTFGKNP